MSFEDLTPDEAVSRIKMNAFAIKNQRERTKAAYHDLEYEMTRDEFAQLNQALGINATTASAIFDYIRLNLSGWKSENSDILRDTFFTSSLLALRGKSVMDGLSSLNEAGLEALVKKNFSLIKAVESTMSWFGRLYLPSNALSDMLAVFGAKISPDFAYNLALQYDAAGTSTNGKFVRFDFAFATLFASLAKVE